MELDELIYPIVKLGLGQSKFCYLSNRVSMEECIK